MTLEEAYINDTTNGMEYDTEPEPTQRKTLTFAEYSLLKFHDNYLWHVNDEADNE